MRIPIICHPQAGGGVGQKVWQAVRDELTALRLFAVTYFTDAHNPTALLVRQLLHQNHVNPIQKIIVIGGDGTLNEVVTALKHENVSIPVIYFAAGGMDHFQDVWQPKATIRDMIEALLYKHHSVTIPMIARVDHLSQRESVVLDHFALGFPAEANFRAKQISQNKVLHQLTSPRFRYGLGQALTLPEIPHFTVRVTLDDEVHVLENVSALSIRHQNRKQVKTGLMITEEASQQLAVTITHDVKMGTMIQMAKHWLDANHPDASNDYTWQAVGDHITIETSQPVRAMMDGEDLTQTPQRVSFSHTNYPFILPN